MKLTRTIILIFLFPCIVLAEYSWVDFFIEVYYKLVVFPPMKKQIRKGQEFISQMDEELLITFINDAYTYKNDSLQTENKYRSLRIDEFPKEYEEVGIIGVRISESYVSFVWMGGLDHTSFGVGFTGDSVTRIGVSYNDYSTQQIYPKLEPVYHERSYTKDKKKFGNTVIDAERLKVLVDSVESIWQSEAESSN